MKRSRRAVELKHSGMNCGQAILLAFGDKTGLSDDELKKVGAAFGIGMGCFESTCGALCGAQMVLGLARYNGKPLVRDARNFLEEFKKRVGATNCGEIRGKETGKPLCDCDNCLIHACDIAGEALCQGE